MGPRGFLCLFLLVSVILLSGRGANLIAGYNTASRQEKIDEKKLCRVTEAGMLVILVLLLILALGLNVLASDDQTAIIR